MLRVAGPRLSFLCVHFSLTAVLQAAEPPTAARPLPTAGEAKILAALARPTAVDFAENPLRDVVEFLKEKHEVDIQLDVKALTDAGVGTDTPITATLEGTSLRSLLRLLLGQLDLTYVVRDGYLFITSKSEAENMLRVQVYPVADLVKLDSEFRPPLLSQHRGEDYSSLIDLIVNTVEPTTWDEVGGPGSIQENAASHSITCAQTEEAHEQVADLLASLRRVRDKQLAAAREARPADAAKHPANKDGQEMKVYHLLRTPAHSTPTRNSGGGMGGAALGGALMVADDAASGEGAKTQDPLSNKAPGNTDSSASKPKEAAKPATAKTPAEPDMRQLDDWAKELAEILPELLDPNSWKPKGTGSVRAVAGTIIVQHSREMQEKVAALLGEVFSGRIAVKASARTFASRLPSPGPQVDWPQDAEPQPAANEARIHAALGENCDLDVSEEPLGQVIATLAKNARLPVWIDHKALTDAGLGTDTPVTSVMQGVKLRTVLKRVLDELDLTYVVHNEVLVITSKSEAENMLSTKIYPVFDLIGNVSGDLSAGVPQRLKVLGMAGDDFVDRGLPHAASAFGALIGNITSTIPPTTWDYVGGPGAIREFVNSGALVISQTTEVHEEIAEYLRALREVAAAQR